jgi:hypothetical protein
MKRAFCDLCGGEPTDPSINDQWHYPVPVKTREHHGAKCVVRVAWIFTDHPRGFGGPPDLCRACAIAMLEGLVKAKREEQP